MSTLGIGSLNRHDIVKIVSVSIFSGLTFVGLEQMGLSSFAILILFLLGVFISNIITIPASFETSIQISSSLFLEVSLVFLGVGINVQQLGVLGWETIFSILLVMAGVLLTTIWMAKKFKCPASTGWLIGFGTAVCGTSAIASVAPIVSKDKHDAAIAMAVVNLLGAAAMLILPMLLLLYSTSEVFSSFAIGASLHSVSNVAGAAYSINEEVGTMSLTIKMVRVAMLAPSIFIFIWLTKQEKGRSWKSIFNFPRYVWAFLLVAILSVVLPIPTMLLVVAEFVGKLLLAISMFAIGLKTSIHQAITKGKKGFMFGLVIFIIQLCFILVVFNVIK